MVPKGLEMGASKQAQITKIIKTTIKTHPQSRPPKRLYGRGQTSKIDDSYTLSAVFSEAQGSQKGVKMGAKMEPQGTQTHTKQEKISLKKTSKTQHC